MMTADREPYYKGLEFQGPTGPQILAPAVGWLATLTYGFASLKLNKLGWRDVYTNKRMCCMGETKFYPYGKCDIRTNPLNTCSFITIDDRT